MWIRKHLDISEADLRWAAGRCFIRGNAQSATQEIESAWGREPVLVTLSVRSTWDLMLSSCGWRHGDEVIFSGLTIPDMPRIARRHGLIPVAVDIESSTLAPDATSIASAITARTRAVVIAHLFGGRCPLGEIAALCRRSGIMLVEDAAQAWVGPDIAVASDVDVSLTSFGPIKTNTALGGGAAVVRDPRLLAAMRARQASWPKQSRSEYLARVAKYLLLLRASSPAALSAIARLCRMLGISHDAVLAGAARGFPAEQLFEKIRRRPADPLVELLRRRLAAFDRETTRRRGSVGERVAQQLNRHVPVPGINAEDRTWWVLSLVADEPERLIRSLWKAGFDATRRCSLQAVDETVPNVHAMLKRLVILPWGPAMPDSELDRMIRIVIESVSSADNRLNGRCDNRPAREYHAAASRIAGDIRPSPLR